MKKIEIAQFGGSETLQLVDAPTPTPTGTQLLVKVAAAGVNFVDIYQRNGNPVYGMTTPYTPGMEGAGVVDDDALLGQRERGVDAVEPGRALVAADPGVAALVDLGEAQLVQRVLEVLAQGRCRGEVVLGP